MFPQGDNKHTTVHPHCAEITVNTTDPYVPMWKNLQKILGEKRLENTNYVILFI